MNIGKSIKIGLAHANMKDKELADHAGMSKNHLSCLKNGRKKATSKSMQSLAEALGYSVSEFIALGEDKKQTFVSSERL